MRKNCTNSLLILGLLLFSFKVDAQTNFFTDIKESNCKVPGQQRVIVPVKYRTITLDTTALLNFLRTVPLRKNIGGLRNAPIFTLPLPNGTSARFYIWESPIIEPVLAAKFPTLKTYTGQGIDDPAAIIKLDWTALGFRAMVLTHKGTVFIDPYMQGTTTNYIAYYKSDSRATQSFIEPSLQPAVTNTIPFARPAGILTGTTVGTQLLTYRWAIACTHQYASAATGLASPTVLQTLSAIMLTVDRVNGVYENELSVNFVIIGNEDKIIFNTSSNDPLGPYNDAPNPATLFNQGQIIIDDSIGEASFDVGQIFSTGAGGATTLGIVCAPSNQNVKAKSAVGIAHPVGDAFNIDYVCHEMGHAFGAHHPFNSDMSYCNVSGQEDPNTNDEPGSGSTIVSYASNAADDGLVLCLSDNLQSNSDPYFNTLNFDEIMNYINVSGTCATVTPSINRDSTGINHPPVVNAGANYTIPLSTPFILTGSATDQDATDTALTYCWEQVDVGGQYCAWNDPLSSNEGNAPLFRSFLPVSVPYRYFPRLSDVINNTTTIGEIKPTYARTLHFRLTARDNCPGNGGVSYSGNTVTVDGNSGPFVVTYPDATGITWTAGESQNITWNPAGTQNAPVSCSNVLIQLSTDGGLTYPDTLIASTPNTGTVQVLVPDSVTNTARIRVMGVGNVFYDISNNNFTIIDSTVPVNWLGFTATRQSNNTASLTWLVDERNVKYYEVERSINGTDFTPIDSMASITGNGNNVQYSYIDANPLLGNNQYRIEEVNADGSLTYSVIRSVSFASVPAAWTIYPNPATSNINILSNAVNSNVELQLYDGSGKLVYEISQASTSPGQITSIPVSNFAKGVYVLKITSATGVKELPLLID
jgi:hypothetical protein